MNAPDKIYVREFAEGVNQMWSHIKATETSAIAQHEYIRKDALLEWAKENEKRLCDLLPLNNQSLVIGGKLYAYQEFIEKIESL